jgi:hypothetical protein
VDESAISNSFGNFATGDISMKKLLLTAAVAVLPILPFAGSAQAHGCLKGAAVGGVAGHFAGHHAVLGALGGCAVGHMWAHHHEHYYHHHHSFWHH